MKNEERRMELGSGRKPSRDQSVLIYLERKDHFLCLVDNWLRIDMGSEYTQQCFPYNLRQA